MGFEEFINIDPQASATISDPVASVPSALNDLLGLDLLSISTDLVPDTTPTLPIQPSPAPIVEAYSSPPGGLLASTSKASANQTASGKPLTGIIP
ncbi:unnamed protein product [Protopolystoma xenopodis]|uniref:Uncharacterized protein n=1 Tax=Protopolystoma xenopodis TaxID=117903 RepID=A0A3S4ZGX3_9PLAT|nr:unnamed protein product [Protopolystoma xenopodis]